MQILAVIIFEVRLVVIPQNPRLILKASSEDSHFASLTVPSEGEMVRRIKTIGNPDLFRDFNEASLITRQDLASTRINGRLASLVRRCHFNHQKAVDTFKDEMERFSKQFLMQARTLIWSGKLPLSIDELERRFNLLSFELLNPLQGHGINPECSTRRLAVRMPIPFLTGAFDYSDFVHEALHGISGRAVATVTQIKTSTSYQTSLEVLRTGLSFEIPVAGGKMKTYFEWLNEGIVESLVPLFVSSGKGSEDIYEEEVKLLRLLTDPEGKYKVPMASILAAFFADYQKDAETGLKFPEWHDLNKFLPAKQLRKMDRLIEKYDIEAILELMSIENIFTIPERHIIFY